MNTPTEEEIVALFGITGAREYQQAYDKDKAAILAFARRLPELSDEELFGENVSANYMAAVANSRGLYRDASWAFSSACYQESLKRWKAAGHTEDCEGTSIYQAAQFEAARQHGHNIGSPTPCTCPVHAPLAEYALRSTRGHQR